MSFCSWKIPKAKSIHSPRGGQGGWHADEVGVSDKALFADAGAAQGVAPGQLELIDIIFNLIN